MPADGALLELIEVSKSFGSAKVLTGINLTVGRGEFLTLLGPSGCGKTTLLRMIAGLEDISSGELQIGEQVVNTLPPSERGVAMVFQSYALYPHKTVYDNMAFGLKIAKVPKDEIQRRVNEAAGILQLNDYLQRLPKALSGGQRQRVAIARALVNSPSILLADEPTGNLDSATSSEIMKVFEELAEQGQTVIMVTHEADIAAHARRVVALHDGQVSSDTRRARFVRENEHIIAAKK